MSNPVPPRMNQRPQIPGTGSGWSMLLRLPIIGLVVVLVIVWSSYTIIDQGSVGVKLRFGEAISTLGPGFHLVVPFMERVVVFSTRTTKQSYENVNAYSKDIQAADCLVSVNYRTDPTRAIQIYSSYGDNYVDTIISPILAKRFKEIFGKYDAADIVNLRDKLGVEIENNVRQNMPPGIIIEGVQIENIDFSDKYEAAREEAAQAEAMVRKARQELEQRKVDAEKIVVQANAEALARVTSAKAEADAIRLRGEAEAAALLAKAGALKDNPGYVALTAAEKWDGKLPTTFVPGSAIPFVNVPRGATPQ